MNLGIGWMDKAKKHGIFRNHMFGGDQGWMSIVKFGYIRELCTCLDHLLP